MFRVFPCNAQKRPLFDGWKELASADPARHAEWSHAYGQNLAFWSIPTGPSTGLLVLDVDVKDGKEGLKSLEGKEIPHTMCQRTRTGGIHYFFRYPQDGRRYGNRVNFLPGLDTRGEGGYVIYYGVDMSMPIAEAPQWLIEYAAQKPVEASGDVYRVGPEIAQGIIENALENVRHAAGGESNDTLNKEAFRVGQLIAAQAVTYDWAFEALLRAAIERGKPVREARATIKSGLEGGMKHPLTSPFSEPKPLIEIPVNTVPPPPAPPERWTPKGLSRLQLLDTTKLRKPQLFQHWSTEDLTITTADGGTGKTTMKLQEAICLALGERFLGFDCKQTGRTLFITGEDTSEKLAAMVGKICEQMGLFEKDSAAEDKLNIVEQSIFIKKDSDLCLIQKDPMGFLVMNPTAFNKVMEAVEDIRPKMIVFDPISSFWGSEAAVNDMAKAVAKFMQRLVENAQACVEMINHAGKASSTNKDMSQFAGRGGTGLPSHSRVNRVLRRIQEEEFKDLTGEDPEANKTPILCNVSKFSDGSPLLDKQFLVMRDRFLFFKKDVSPAKAQEIERATDDLDRVFAAIKEARQLNRYPTKAQLIAEFSFAQMPLSKARVENALNKLVFSGLGDTLVKTVDSPDMTSREKVYVLTDMDGKEL